MMETKVVKTRKKAGGRTVGTPNKSTAKAREAIAEFVDGNAHQLQSWLEQIAIDEKYGPKVAFDCFMSVAEYHVPKLARQEHVGADGGALTIQIVRYADDTNTK
jgi:hypothetical protein